MGVAETSKLIASLGLKDQFSGPLKAADNALGKFDVHLGKTQTRVGKGAAQLTAGVINATKIAVAGIGTLTGLLLLSAKEGQDALKVQNLYAQAIANSGKVSAAQVAILDAQQTAIMNLTGADDELIKSEQTRLISMGLTGDAVARLIPLIQDAALVTGKDAEQLTVAIGKAALGNVTALQKLGIIIPKTTAATKSAALASLEQAKAQLLVKENLDKSHGALTKSEKAHYAQKKAALDAAIGQQKLTDAQKAGAKSGSALDTVTGALTKSFGGAAQAVSGGLDVKLKVLNEALSNVRESAGQKLLPALTRIVDVVATRLVPAFGKFIDVLLPPAIAGLDKLASFLEGGGASAGFESLLGAAKTAAPIIADAADKTFTVVKAAVGLFASLPPEIQALAVAGLAINKLTGGLVTNIAGGLISAVISSFRGLMNVNAASVIVNGPVGGVPGVTGGGGVVSRLLNGLPLIGIGIIASEAAQQLANAFLGVVRQPLIDAGVPPSGADAATGTVKLVTDLFTGHPLDALNDLPKIAGDVSLLVGAANHQVLAIPDQFRREDRTYDGIENMRGQLADGLQVDIRNAAAVGAAITKAQTTHEQRLALDKADAAARGIRFQPGHTSTSLDPRFGFLGAGHKGTADVAVADALTAKFERNKGVLYTSDKNLKKAIDVLTKDQRTLGPKSATAIGKDIERLKTELARRTDAAKTRAAEVARAAQRAVVSAIQRQDLTANVNVDTSFNLNGRLVVSDLQRFTTFVGTGISGGGRDPNA